MAMEMHDRLFQKGDIVRHFKGNFYRIICIPRHSETGEKYVVYSALYPPYNEYVRPYSMFSSKVDKEKYPDADQPYRFMRVWFPYRNKENWFYIKNF